MLPNFSCGPSGAASPYDDADAVARLKDRDEVVSHHHLQHQLRIPSASCATASVSEQKQQEQQQPNKLDPMDAFRIGFLGQSSAFQPVKPASSLNSSPAKFCACSVLLCSCFRYFEARER
jgi:protein involved in polysaccharide export with SLBB domain